MKKYIALDIGDARIGVAACLNPLGIVSPVCVFNRTRSIKADVRRMAELILSHKADKVIIGLPVGCETGQIEKNREFAERLMRRSEMPEYEYWNEAFTSIDADTELAAMGVSFNKRKKIIDSTAAVLILESYLADKENGT